MKTLSFLLFCAVLGALMFQTAPRELQVRSFFAGEEISLVPIVSAFLAKDGAGRTEYDVQKIKFSFLDGKLVKVTYTLGDENDSWDIVMKDPQSSWRKLSTVRKISITTDERGELINYEGFDAKGERIFKMRHPRGDIASRTPKPPRRAFF